MAIGLNEIVKARRRTVAEARRTANISDLERRAGQRGPRGFRRALEQRASERGLPVIAELKKASPSRGLIREDFNVQQLASAFARAGAAALSVLTEPEFFQGSVQDLEMAARSSGLPCLRKDFIVDEFQLLEGRAFGADAVLLIVATLSDPELKRLRDAAAAFELDVLCEVHDEAELRRAIALGCQTIGVNNRDLQTLHVDLNTALRLAPLIPAGALRVAESGISSATDIERLRAVGYQAFLIGEMLMKAERPEEALRALISQSSIPAGARAPA